MGNCYEKFGKSIRAISTSTELLRTWNVAKIINLSATNDEQQSVTVNTNQKKQEFQDDEKEYVEIEDITDEEYGQKKPNKEGPTSSSPSAGKQKKAQEKDTRTGAIVAPTTLPFPHRQSKSKEDDGQFKKFLEILSQLHINIPFVEALKQIPTYVKFMKEVLTRKRVWREFETIAMTKSCTSIIKNKLPVNKDDPGLGEARPTTVSLQLADRSMVYLEDVTLRVNDEKKTFNMFKAIKQPSNVEECSFIRVTDGSVDLKEAHFSIVTRNIEEHRESTVQSVVSRVKEKHDLNDSVTESTLPSLEKVYVLELKRPPEHLMKVGKKRMKHLLRHEEFKMQNHENTKIQKFGDEKWQAKEILKRDNERKNLGDRTTRKHHFGELKEEMIVLHLKGN
uniref:Uncharacterized protein n=1 Tax=Lactuca sativa TaxID=4236 RepID=A0A9R1X2Q4_LACSA|nr:hypothetical protein LSAT_V11C700352860 [Lactuca sativa]